MALFQKSVLQKYLRDLDAEKVNTAWGQFQSHFQNPDIQENIRNSKEEQYQEGFLRDLFVKVLGYTLNPNSGFNLTTELKNIKDAKKTDGAIIKNGKALAVIELKGTDTADLSKVEGQAFGYKNNQPECGYVITSNFEKLRFYIDNGGLFAVDEILDHIVIDDDLLFKHTGVLSNYDFESEVSVNILGHIFEHSLNEIEEIQAEIETGRAPDTKVSRRKKDGVFYTPRYITKYIVDHTVKTLCEEKKSELGIDDAEYEKERKGRKKETIHALIAKLDAYRNWLLDLKICDPACGSGAFLLQALEFLIAEHRYIDELQNKLLGNFIPFANTKNSILEKNLYGVDINEESVEIAKLSLWLRTAEKGRKLTSLNDNIKCGNSLIDDPAVAGEKAFNWYESFPHVFSLKEKLGYHIVLTTHNSCTSQRMMKYNVQKGDPIELNLEEEIALTKIIGDIIIENEYHCIAYNICKDHVHLILVSEEDELTGIIQKMKSISSKEFHRLYSRPRGHDPLSSSSMGRDPLDHTSMGRDPLDESTRSHDPADHGNHLWSQKFYHADLQEWKVASLSHHPGYLYDDDYLGNVIEYVRTNREKHGLPHSPKLRDVIETFTEDADEAFCEEYKGGFDVVIGNPPYVRAEFLGNYFEYFSHQYRVYNSSIDLFAYFYELGSVLIKPDKGRLGFISNTFDKTKAGRSLRDYLATRTTLHEYIDFTEVRVFEGATTYPVIIIFDRNKPYKNQLNYVKIPKDKQSNSIDILSEQPIEVPQKSLETDSWAFLPKQTVELLNKLSALPTIRDIYGKCYYGIKTGLNEAFIVDANLPQSDQVKYIYEGKEIRKWYTPDPVQSLILFESKSTVEKYGEGLAEDDYLDIMKRDYSDIMGRLLPYMTRAKNRYDKGDFWWELRNCAYYHLFDKPKIIFPNLQNANKFSLDLKEVFINAPAVFLPIKSKTVLCILNSKLVWFFLKSICVVRSGGYIEVKPQYFEQIPIPELKNGIHFEGNADMVIGLTRDHQVLCTLFLELVLSKFSIDKVSKKLQNWPEISFGEFLKELKKNKVQLSLPEEAEWLEYFKEQKDKATSIQTEIKRVDREIDAMVYELYGLTEEEIALVDDDATRG